MENQIKITTNFQDIPDDVIRVVNKFLDFRSTASLKTTCKRYNSILNYNFYKDEYANYNPYYKDTYPLLIENQKEVVTKFNIINGPCISCGEEKQINEFGIIDFEEIENPNSFKRMRMKEIICENMAICQFSNLESLHLHRVSVDYFHLPLNLKTLIIEQSEFEDITLTKNLEILVIEASDIESIEVNDKLQAIHASDSFIALEGDPQLKVFIAVHTKFYHHQAIYGIDFEVLILDSIPFIEFDSVTTNKLYLKNTDTELEPDSYNKFMSEEEIKEFKVV